MMKRLDVKSVGFHEAGHAIVAIGLKCRLAEVSIDPAEGTGICRYEAPPDSDFDRIAAALGGLHSQLRHDPNLAHTQVGQSGGDFEQIESILKRRYARECELDLPIVRAAREKAEKILEVYWPAVEELAGLLMEDFRVEGRKAHQIYEKHLRTRIRKAMETI